MVVFINREELDTVKYDQCVEKSLQHRIYAMSWYLDIACDTWGAFVMDDYTAVMPVPWNKKYTIKYVYPPLWVLELGIFSREEIKIDVFMTSLLEQFKFIELRLNTDNILTNTYGEERVNRMQWISLKEDYNDIYSRYRKDRKRDLTKAKTFGLRGVWGDDPKNLIQLFKNNIGKRDKNIGTKDYQNLLSLISICKNNGVGEVLSVYDADDGLVASAFFLVYKGKVTILVSSTDLNNRKNGANTFLIDRAIYRYGRECTIFNFGGSSIESIASYFRSFGAVDSKYSFIKHNRLPGLIKLFKR